MKQIRIITGVRIRVFVSAAVLAILLVPNSGPAAATLFEIGKPFPQIVLPSLDDGPPISQAQFRGKKIILHIFASW